MNIFLTQQPWMVFINLAVLVILYFLYKPAYRGSAVSVFRRRTGAILVLLFCLFSFWGTDWFSYYFFFDEIRENPNTSTHLEDVYVWIIKNVAFDYISFRLIIWGTALFLFYDTLKRLKIDVNLAFFLFATMSLIWFSYARVSLSMSLLFWGVSVIIGAPQKRQVLRMLIGLVAIFFTYYLHKSSIFGITIIVLSLLMNLFGKKFYVILLLLFPLLVLAARYYLNSFMLLEMMGSDEDLNLVVSSAQSYLERGEAVKGMGAIIQRLLEITPYYLMAILCIRIKSFRAFCTIPFGIKIFINTVFLIVVLSTVFLFVPDVNTSIIYIRFLRFGFIPGIIVMSYCLKNGYLTKYIHNIWQIGFLGSLYAVSYSLYISSVS